MADGVFLVGIHLCKRAAVGFVGRKHAVVAKAHGAVAFSEYFAFHNALKQQCFVGLAQCYACAKLCRAVGDAVEIVQQQVDVVFAVAVVAGIACRVDTRSTVERRHFKPGVVGKAVVAVVLLDVVGFDFCVTLDGRGCFGNVVVAADVAQA